MLKHWRLILDPAYGGALNMAIDSALLGSADAAPDACATLRLYSWSVPTISVGYRQDPEQFKGFGLPVVKRLTGGRAVLHDSELTYSVTVPESNPFYSSGISKTYAVISRCLVAALKDVGVERADFVAPVRKGSSVRAREARSEACFLSSSRYEVVVDGKKMVGSAQRRLGGALLQHGSILTGVDPVALESIFGSGLLDKITWLGAHTGSTVAQLRIALVKRFEAGIGVKLLEEPLTEAEKRVVDAALRSSKEAPLQAGLAGCAPHTAL